MKLLYLESQFKYRLITIKCKRINNLSKSITEYDQSNIFKVIIIKIKYITGFSSSSYSNLFLHIKIS